MLLKVQNLEVNYGNISALKGITLDVAQGELVALIGSNGAGKTTLLKTISGLLKPVAGDILFENQSLIGTPAHRITAKGIAHSPEGRRVFAQQSVKDNLLLGAYPRFRKEGRKAVEESLDKIYAIFPKLKERSSQLSGTLSGGEQQMLAIGRGLMLNPRLLLLDEPTMGLAPVIIDEVFAVIQRLKESQAVTILLVEQLAYRALKVADRAYVLEQGLIRLQGTGKDLLTDPDVQRAYLGAKKAHTAVTP